MNYYIITGISSGLGEALGAVAADQDGADATVIGISRRGNSELGGQIVKKGAAYFDYRIDLSEPAKVEERWREIADRAADGKENRLVLINNAAMEGPIGPAETLDRSSIVDHLTVNLASAMLLTGLFLRTTEGWAAQRTVINITSGAAQHPYDGMSLYCATKAGLNMFGRCVAEEQQGRDNPVRVVAVAPGVLDTPMQERMRATDGSLYSGKEKFVSLHREGGLTRPGEAAFRLLSLLDRDDIENGAVLDLRHL